MTTSTPAQPISSSDAAETITLRDGSELQLRFLTLADTERLKAFFYRLSPESVFYRLLEYRTALTDDEARQLCDIDGQNRVAIAALQNVAGQDEIRAVARYGVISPDTPDMAESAIVVEDAFQKRGLGSILIRRLVIYARAHGVARLIATVHYNNAQILRFIERSGLRVERTMNQGVWEFVIYLDPPPASNGHSA